MLGECSIKINKKDVGVLFGVRIFQIIKDEKLNMTENPNDQMNFVNTIWAGIKNNFDLLGEDCDITIKDVYQLMNNDFGEFEKALKCYSESKVMGKPVIELGEEVKKKMKKKTSIFGRIFRKTASVN